MNTTSYLGGKAPQDVFEAQKELSQWCSTNLRLPRFGRSGTARQH